VLRKQVGKKQLFKALVYCTRSANATKTDGKTDVKTEDNVMKWTGQRGFAGDRRKTQQDKDRRP